MGTGSVRRKALASATVLLVFAGAIILAGPAGAADGVVTGVAVLESEPNDLPVGPLGTVSYKDVTETANHLVAHQDGVTGDLTLEDPGVVIVPAHVTSGPQNCTGGVGSASCRYARWFVIHTAGGDDELRLDGVPMDAYVASGAGDDQIVVAVKFARIDCGGGYDEVVATGGVVFTQGCEVVTQT